MLKKLYENSFKKFGINTTQNCINFNYFIYKFKTNNYFEKSTAFGNKNYKLQKIYTNSNLSKINKFYFSTSPSQIEDSENIMKLDKLILEIKYENIETKVYHQKKITSALSLICSIPNKSLIEDSEKNLIEILRNPTFYENLKRITFADLFFYFPFLNKDFITEQDITNLEDHYFRIKESQDTFTMSDRLKIIDALYYYENFLNIELSNVKKDIFEFFISNLLSLHQDDLMTLLKNILYLKNDEIKLFSEKLPLRMHNILDINDNKITLGKKVEILQFYPKIVKSSENPILIEKDKEKILKFFFSKLDMNLIDPAPLLCFISNYYYFLEINPTLLEHFLPYFYNNLSSFYNEYLLEFFFLILNTDLSQIKNKPRIDKFFDTLYQSLKKSKTHERQFKEKTKDILYFLEVREKVKVSSKEWFSKHKPEDGSDDFYLMKIFEEFIKKSTDLFPFAAREYKDELYDKMFSNLKKLLKF